VQPLHAAFLRRGLPNSAITKREEDGLVLRDEDKCKGAQLCRRACPYKKIYFNKMRNVSQHCIGCFPRIEQGVAPACVRQCPPVRLHRLPRRRGQCGAQARQKWKVRLPLHPEFGTHRTSTTCRRCRRPPLREDGSFDESGERIPKAYLEKLFGPNVHRCARRAEDGTRSEAPRPGLGRHDALILYRWKDALGHLTRDPADIVWK